MYKVFINTKSVSFFKNIRNNKLAENTKAVDYMSAELLIAEYRNFMVTDSVSNLFINCGSDVNKIFRIFKSRFVLLKAAGGVVKNDNGDILFIYRHNKWDLPKGKAEKNEKLFETAIREVKEETGIGNIAITGKYSDTFHIYSLEGKEILKQTSWFGMHSTDESSPIPQTEEDITQVRWFKPAEMHIILSNTYDSLRDMVMKLK